MTWAAQPRSERPLEVDDVQGIASSKSKRPGQCPARTDDDEILESLIDSSERPASLGCAGPRRHSQTKTDIAACSKTTTSLIAPVLHAHLQIVPPAVADF
jgi:hypothetical protein